MYARPLIVAGAPEGHELLARLQRPLRAGHEVRDLDGEFVRLGGQHLERQQGRDLLAEPVLRLELGAIGPGLKLGRPGRLAGGIGRQPLLGDDFAQFPGVGIGGIGLGRTLNPYPSPCGRREPRIAHHRSEDRPLAEDVRPGHLFRLLEAVDLQRTFGPLRLAVERRRGKRDLDVLAGGKPIVGAKRCLQGRVAGLDRPLGGAGFAVGVGHVGRDLELEDRLVLLGDREVRLGDELDRERAVGLGLGRAVGDFLRRPAACATRSTSTTSRIADFADDVVADLGPAHRRPGVGHRLALQLDLAAQLGGGLRGVERHLELGPLVLLDVDPGIALQIAVVTWIIIRPISRSRGAVKLPLNEP